MKSLRIWLLVGLCLVLGGTLLGYTPFFFFFFYHPCGAGTPRA